MSSKLNIFRSRYAMDILRPKSHSRFSIGTFSLGTLLLISNIISYCRISLLWKFSQISPGNCILSLSKFNNHSNYKFRKMLRVLFNICRTNYTIQNSEEDLSLTEVIFGSTRYWEICPRNNLPWYFWNSLHASQWAPFRYAGMQ